MAKRGEAGFVGWEDATEDQKQKWFERHGLFYDPHISIDESSDAKGAIFASDCQRDLIGTDCRCPACEERRVEAAEYAREASEGR